MKAARGAWLLVLVVVGAPACAQKRPARPAEPAIAEAPRATPSAPLETAAPSASSGPAPVDTGPIEADDVPERRSVPSEPSRYGHFELKVDSQRNCRVSFLDSFGKRHPVLQVPDCIGDRPGLDVLGAARRVGVAPLPALGLDGDEFHLFAVTAARGGNGVVGDEYWVVVARRDSIWATPLPYIAVDVSDARVEDGPPSRWVLEQTATPASEGARHVAQFGRITTTTLPKRASWVVSKKKTVLVGPLQSGGHATGFRPTIAAGGEPTVIDEEGTCKLPKLDSMIDDEAPVRMTAEVTTWSDGRTHVKCVDVRR